MSLMRTILVTGCTRGLGRALVNEFCRVGQTVAGCGTREAHVEQLKVEHSYPHRFDAVDVTDRAKVDAWVLSVIKSMGVPDLVINNAALINHPAPFWEVDAEQFDRLIDVNIKGMANVCRAVLPHMLKKKTGVIVNMSSGWGRGVSPKVAPYCTSKFAVEGLTQALASELPEGMAAIPLSPGIINTDMLRQIWGRRAGGYEDPEVWARTAAPFILSLGPEHNGKSLSAP